MTAVHAVVLAAGAGRRMGGRPKALLRVGGRTLLETVVGAAWQGGVDGVVVVVGHYAEAVAPAARALSAAVATNPDPDRGMGTSAREGARLVPEGAALLLWPVDVPFVRGETVAAILAAGRGEPDRVIVPVHAGGEGGHPTLLPPRLVDEVRRLPDDGRVDHLIAAEADEPLRLEVDDPGVTRDLDLPEDLVSRDVPS